MPSQRTPRSTPNRALRTVAVLAMALAFLLSGCVPFGDEASQVLEDLGAGSGPSALKARTPPPTRQRTSYIGAHGPQHADLYVPAVATRAAIVLVPGLEPRGGRDPRLVAFANTLARVGFLALVPDLPGLRAQRVGEDEVEGIADAVSELRIRLERGRLEVPVGIAAFSYAVGPSVLAALRPELQGRVDFILAVGGYHDLGRCVAFSTTGWYRVAGEWRHGAPSELGKWVFVLGNAERLSDPGDRDALRQIALRKLSDPQARIDDLVALLGPDGQAVYALITNREPERVPALIEALPSSLHRVIEAMDLANKDLTDLGARLILVHGTDDDVIPYTESVALARAAGEGRARLFLIDGLAHVDLRPEALDRWGLWRAVREVLDQRAPDAG